MSFYTQVPTDRSKVHGPWSWILWAFFGNDDDGLFGGDDQPKDSKQFWRWWRRNKAHNLSFQVLRRPVLSPRYIIGAPVSGMPENEVHQTVVLRFNPFFLKLGFFYIGWRADEPLPIAWGGKYGLGGGKWDVGLKEMT